MAAEDAAVVVTLRANLKDYETALKSAVRATEKAAKAAEQAVSGIGKKAPMGALNDNFSKSANQIANDARVLQFQLNDIFSGIASGQGIRAVQQQLGQIAQQLGGGGMVQAARTLGTALVGMINPINLAVVAFGLAATAAAAYFGETEEDAKKARDAIKKVADELDRIAKAHPTNDTLQKVAEDARKAADATQAAADKATVLTKVYEKADAEIVKTGVGVADTITILQGMGIEGEKQANVLQQAFIKLQTAIEERSDATDELKGMQDALNQSMVQTIPAIASYADAFGKIVQMFKDAVEAGKAVIQTFDDVAKKQAAPLIGPPMPPSYEIRESQAVVEQAAERRKEAEKAAKEAAKAAERASEENRRELEQAAKEAADKLNEAIVNQTKVSVDIMYGMLGKSETANRGEVNAFLKRGGVDLDAAQTAWCAAFVNSALAQVGIQGSGSNIATDFLNFGQGVQANEVRRGDVLVEPRGRSAGEVGGHVGLATGSQRFVEGVQQLEMISGNASDQVQTDWINASEVVARRASEAFELPAEALTHLSEESRKAAAEAQKLAEEHAKAAQQINQQFANIIGGALSGFIQDLVAGKDAGDAFASAIQRITSQLIDMMIQMLVIKPLMTALGGGIGGGGIGIPGMAGGGNVSNVSGASHGKVSPMAFAGAQHMASGGIVGFGANAVPIIAHRGEVVVPNARRLAGNAIPTGRGNTYSMDNARINIDMAQTGLVAANNDDAKEFGRNVQKLVQAEMVRESLARRFAQEGQLMAGFDGTVPCWIPDIPSQRDDELRIRTAQFGDGYAQRTLDGINYFNNTWSLTWELREAADVNAMVNYLVAAKGNAFSYKEMQTGNIYQVWCDSWHVEWVLRRKGPLYWGTLSAEFRRAYGITA